MDEKLLLIAGDADFRHAVIPCLRGAGYAVCSAPNGESAVRAAAADHPFLLLSQCRLCDMRAEALISRIRTWSSMPILVCGSEASALCRALDAGADAYLPPRVGEAVLLSLVRALLRRHERHEETAVFQSGPLTLDFGSGLAYLHEKRLHLTPTEYKLLSLLASSPDKLLTHEMIMTRIWGKCGDEVLASLRVFMASLRKKLSVEGCPDLIQTHIGIGYRMMKKD